MAKSVFILAEESKRVYRMSDKKEDIDREYLFVERRALLQRLGQLEDLLNIPRSVVTKKMRRPFKQFLEEYKGVELDDCPEDDLGGELDVSEGGPE